MVKPARGRPKEGESQQSLGRPCKAGPALTLPNEPVSQKRGSSPKEPCTQGSPPPKRPRGRLPRPSSTQPPSSTEADPPPAQPPKRPRGRPL